MAAPDAPRIGIDLGGTKIEGIVLDRNGQLLRRLRRPTPQGSYTRTLGELCDLVAELERGFPTLSVGVGTPGAICPRTGRMKNANSVTLNGEDLLGDLQQRLARPVRLANDANCFALSEAVDGSGSGQSVVFGVILGTGVGGGVVVKRRALVGPNAIAGEWGHNPLPQPTDRERPGPACYCGQQGCIESWLSGPALAADHQRETGCSASAETIARATDPDSLATMERYYSRLARALAGVINLIDPDCIVLGGGLSKITRLYERVPELWQRWVFSETVHTPLLPPLHGDSGGTRGAAWLWP